MLKVAQYAAQLEDYDKAIQIYEQVNCPHCENSFEWFWIYRCVCVPYLGGQLLFGKFIA